MSDSCISVSEVSHSYGTSAALNEVSFSVLQGKLFGLLGPNGSGKTTLFRLMATLLPLQKGQVTICGHNLLSDPDRIRRSLGITFQSPAVDPRLTVSENLWCHGRIYGQPRQTLQRRIPELLERFQLSERLHSMVGDLSGGLRRRVELAKGLLHQPDLLLLDEPSTGLDPVARRQFWELVHDQQQREGTTVVVSTHLMEEAAGCDHLLLLDRGHVVADGSPDELQASVGGERLTIRTRDNASAQQELQSLLNADAQLVGDRIVFRPANATEALGKVMNTMGDIVTSAEVSRPTLEDVFIERTGRDLSDAEETVV